MKNIAIIAILAITFASCNQKKSENDVHNMEGMTENEMTTTDETVENESEAVTKTVVKSSFSINEIVSNYLKIKNAFTKDDSNSAADAGKTLVETLTKIDMKSLSGEQMKSYMEVADDAKEHAEHIAANAGKIEHQREHFAMLSKDVNDLIKTFGTTQKLYQDYCPMYDQGKSGYWISETKDIKNPYFGSKMLTCGSIKKEW